jgi:hypothetical protein
MKIKNDFKFQRDHAMAQADHKIINTVQLFIRRLTEDGITVESAYLFDSHAFNRAGR